MDAPNSWTTESTAQEHLEKALNFQRMGMMAAAEHELQLARQMDPAIVADPRYQSFSAHQVEQQTLATAWKLPMRVGAGILLVNLLMLAIFWLINFTAKNYTSFLLWSVADMGVNLFLAINLIRLKEYARMATIWWAVIILIFGGIVAMFSLNWIDGISQTCLSASLLVLLVGKPSKVRTGLAIAIFALGYLGTICGFFAYSFLTASR